MNVTTGQMQPSASVPPTGPADSNPGLTVTSFLVVALAYVPLLIPFFINLWSRPHYQFFPLALAGALFLAWTCLKETPRPLEPGSPLVNAVLLALSLVLLGAATVLWSPWLGSLAALSGLIAILWRIGGQRLFKSLFPALLLLATIIPPPLAIDVRTVQHLRALAVDWSSLLLDLLRVTHSLSGNVIELPGQKLLVDEACSGNNSLLITLASCLFYGLWRRRPAWHIAVCLVSSLGFVLLGNLTRIVLGASLKFHYGVDILKGWPHELIGLVLFIGYVFLIMSMDQLLVFLSAPSYPQPPPAPAPAPSSPADRQPRPRRVVPRFGRAMVCSFALLGAAGLGIGWTHYHRAKLEAALPAPVLSKQVAFNMPDEIGDWKRLSPESPRLQKVETLGVYSQIWHYQKGDTVASVALDYPFKGYHDVTVCYTANGWSVVGRVPCPGQPGQALMPAAEVQMRNDVGQYGSLWFSSVDDRGRWLEQPGQKPGVRYGFLRRFRLPAKDFPTTYQVQVLVTGYVPLPPAEQKQVLDFFEQARLLLWRRLFEQNLPKP
ncbi:MAG: exosortase U [Verrucomicrobia bacterium]|nr:exosortase U [Verrucomicrobiota bacterium]